MTDELVAFHCYPLARILRTVHTHPFLFALAARREALGQFICYRHYQMLLLREWKRFKRAENTSLVYDFQLLCHDLIVPATYEAISLPLLPLQRRPLLIHCID